MVTNKVEIDKEAITEVPIIDIKNLRVQYKTERAVGNALNGLSFRISQGESVGLVGESGAGKTTTALSILNLLPQPAGKVLEGNIEFRGKSVFEMSMAELQAMRGGRVAMIFQNPLTALNPVFTVGEQIAMVLRIHRKLKRKEAMEQAAELLEMVGIPRNRVKDYPNQFSGGMRQRVGIAAGLACNPELLIADEPTTALDVTIQAQILELMKELQRQYSSSLLMITHNLGIISELCENVAVMYGGRIIEYGSVTEVFSSPQHPYTYGLLNALPSLEDRRDRLMAIPGRIAEAQNLPSGCHFHPRCEFCEEKCKQELPELIHVTDNHEAACFHVKGGKNNG